MATPNYTPGRPTGIPVLDNITASFQASGAAVRTTRVKDTEDAILIEKIKLASYEGNVALKQAAIVAYKKAQTPKLKPEGSGVPNAVQTQALNALELEKTNWTKQATASKAKILALTNALKGFKADLAKYTKQTGPVEIPTIKVSSGDADKLIYQYNLPMLKQAYLHPTGPQATSLLKPELLGAPINDFNNARLAWKGVTPSRGTLQMSRLYAENANYSASVAKGQKRNDQPYGFRFLYNPTDITMAWGIVDAFSPEYAQSNSNGMSGVAVGLMKGTIAFTILLNRIEDLGILEEDGSYVNGTFGNDQPYDFNAYSQVRYPPDGTQTVPILKTPPLNSPYGLSEEPSFEERATIWKRGTMYDLEYLFRAMGGYYADYQSGLNGMTADRGWLQPIPMELHLGAGLRYLVRVSSLDLKHMMFNERMVPILTTVNVICTRYYDSPDAFTDPTAYSPETTPTS